MCLRVTIFPLASTIFHLDFGTVPTVYYCCVCIISICILTNHFYLYPNGSRCALGELCFHIKIKNCYLCFASLISLSQKENRSNMIRFIK